MILFIYNVFIIVINITFCK